MLLELVPEGPLLYPPEETTDLAPSVRIAELIREQILRRTHDEVPHSVEVEVEEATERPDGLLVIEAYVWAESDSQKGDPDRVAAARWCARSAAPRAGRSRRYTGARVHLDLSVRVRKGWRGDEGLLDRLGID